MDKESQEYEDSLRINLVLALNKLQGQIRVFEEINANANAKQEDDEKSWKALESVLCSVKTLCAQLTETMEKRAQIDGSLDDLRQKLAASLQIMILEEMALDYAVKLLEKDKQLLAVSTELLSKSAKQEKKEYEEILADLLKKGKEIVVLQEKNVEVKQQVESLLTYAKKLNKHLEDKHKLHENDKRQMQKGLDALETRIRTTEKNIDPNSLFNITEQVKSLEEWKQEQAGIVKSLEEWKQQQAGIQRAPPSALEITNITVFSATAVATVIGITKQLTQDWQTLLIPNFCYWTVFIIVGILLFYNRRYLR